MWRASGQRDPLLRNVGSGTPLHRLKTYWLSPAEPESESCYLPVSLGRSGTKLRIVLSIGGKRRDRLSPVSHACAREPLDLSDREIVCWIDACFDAAGMRCLSQCATRAALERHEGPASYSSCSVLLCCGWAATGMRAATVCPTACTSAACWLEVADEALGPWQPSTVWPFHLPHVYRGGDPLGTCRSSEKSATAELSPFCRTHVAAMNRPQRVKPSGRRREICWQLGQRARRRSSRRTCCR